MGREIAARFLAAEPAQMSVPATAWDAGSEPAFRVYQDHDGRWRVRKEGIAAEATFDSRPAAVAFLRSVLADLPSYRLIEESGGSRTVPLPGGADGSAPIFASSDVGDGLREQLAWADRLSSAARGAPSRVRVLADWFRARQRKR